MVVDYLPLLYRCFYYCICEIRVWIPCEYILATNLHGYLGVFLVWILFQSKIYQLQAVAENEVSEIKTVMPPTHGLLATVSFTPEQKEENEMY